MLTPEDLAQIGSLITAAEQRITSRQDRAVEVIATAITELRTELTTRMDASDRRVDRIADTLANIDNRFSLMNRYADRFDKDLASMGQNYYSHDRAIRELRTRIEALEGRQPSQ